MKKINNILKKKVIYRFSYSGTKETDFLYKKTILKNIDDFSYSELLQINEIIIKYSDVEINLFLNKKKKIQYKYKDLINKIIQFI